MAHLAKYKRGSALNVIDEAERRNTQKRKNIDVNRSTFNRVMTTAEGRKPEQTGRQFLRQRLDEVQAAKGRKVRSDANVAASWVVTRPKEVKDEDLGRFFETVFDFLAHRYGAANVVGGYVHMDEKTPHLHFIFTPVTADMRLNFKAVCPRSDFATFHSDLSKFVDWVLGYPTSILLEDGDPRKLASKVAQADLTEAHEAIRAAVERENADLSASLEARSIALNALERDGAEKVGELRELHAEMAHEVERIRAARPVELVVQFLRETPYAAAVPLVAEAARILEELSSKFDEWLNSKKSGIDAKIAEMGLCEALNVDPGRGASRERVR